MRRARRSMNQINVVPYIDVMLVLLVIFMVATPMMQPAVVNLPSVDKAEKQLPDIPLRIDIKSENHFDLIDQGKTSHYIDQAKLTQHIQQLVEENSQRPVVIAADKTVQYALVMKMMDGLKKAQIARVGLLVESQ